jgi:outer membrane protein assembly factor BamD
MIRARWLVVAGALIGCGTNAAPTTTPAPVGAFSPGGLALGLASPQAVASVEAADTSEGAPAPVTTRVVAGQVMRDSILDVSPRLLTAADSLRDQAARNRRRGRLARRPDKKRLEVTNAVADSILPLAEGRFRLGQYGRAQLDLEKLTSFIRSGDPRFAKLHFLLGESYMGQENHLQAARELRRVSDESGDEVLAPDALLRVADAYADMWRKPELDPSFANTAVATYQEVQSRYPGTRAAGTAQSRINVLQDKLAYKAYKSGLYYFRLKAWDSAIIYFKDLVATYPRTTSAPDALVHLVKAYRIIGYQEDLKETCGYMRRYHAAAPGTADACKGVPEA